jgi:membrane-associated phospholipid phosphatase
MSALAGLTVRKTVRRRRLGLSRPRGGVLAGLLVLAALVLAFCFDDAISAAVQRLAPERSVVWHVIKRTRLPFAWPAYFILAGVLALHPQRIRLLAGLALVAAACFGCAHLLKFVSGRARPDLGLGAYHFEWFEYHQSDSMPSGHTVSAVLLTILALRYLPRCGRALLPLAVLASLSRVALTRHFLSDVIAGAALTWLIAHYCMRTLGPTYYPRLHWHDLPAAAWVARCARRIGLPPRCETEQVSPTPQNCDEQRSALLPPDN